MIRKRGRPNVEHSKSTTFKFRLSESELRKLREIADENMLSMSELLRLWINKKGQSY